MEQDSKPECTPIEGSDAIQRILEERAAVLARPTEAVAAGDTLELVILVVGKERYGIPIQQVHEIQALTAGLTPVPGIPPHWIGLMNLRGRLHPVLDLGHFLNATPFSPTASDAQLGCIVIVSGGGLEVGLLVGRAPGVRQVKRTDIGPPMSQGGRQQELVDGVTPDLLVVLNLETLLSYPRLIVQDELS